MRPWTGTLQMVHCHGDWVSPQESRLICWGTTEMTGEEKMSENEIAQR